MNEKKEKSEKNLDYVDKLLSILENNFFVNPNNLIYEKDLELKETFEIICDIKDLIYNDEIKNDENYKIRGNICKKRLIPLLNFLLKISKNQEYNIKYYDILKYSYKIAARISLEHYFFYREWELKEKSKYYSPRKKILQGYIHYLEEMDTNPNFETLIILMPAGWGKTFTEKISEAWSFGYDPTGAILSLCSNDTVVKAGSKVVMNEIKQPYFGEVFPKMKYDEKDKNFFLKETESDWKLRDCTLGSSYNAATIESNVIGQRASKRIHIDDLYKDHIDAENRKLNQKYFDNLQTVWDTRFIQEAPICKKVLTGTLWSSDDLLARLISYYAKTKKFKKHPKYKYTSISEDGTVAIIRIPALDYSTNESSCPELKSTEEILKKKNAMEEYLFQTTFQQIPTDPEALFFSYTRLKTYSVIPQECTKETYAVIDATRKSGKDFFAMPIHKKLINKNEPDNYYLKDCIFTREATSELYDKIVDKIIENHIVELVIESNVAPELKTNIEKKLAEKKITYCEIREKYNTIQKAMRIEEKKGKIKKYIVFPEKGLYGIKTEMGMFMDCLTSYNNDGVNLFDDAPDSEALFYNEIVDENEEIEEAIEIIPWIRNMI